MLTPAYKLTIRPGADDSSGSLGATSELTSAVPGGGSGKVIDTKEEPKASTITDLTVSLDLDTPANSFTLVMGQVGSFKMERNSEVTIELGYADQDELTQVMKGTVITTEPGLTTARIIGHSAGPLLRNFANETFESSNAGAILSDLADRAGVEVETAEDGIDFPAYVIDGRRSFYHHMRELADLCGFDLYLNPEGKLVFEKFTGGKTVHVFEFAKHIVELGVQRSAPSGPGRGLGRKPNRQPGRGCLAVADQGFYRLSRSRRLRRTADPVGAISTAYSGCGPVSGGSPIEVPAMPKLARSFENYWPSADQAGRCHPFERNAG